MFFRGTVHLLMTFTKFRSDAFGPGCHQLATSTAIYASPCQHLTEGSCCGSGWCSKASRVSFRQTYWLLPKSFTENYKFPRHLVEIFCWKFSRLCVCVCVFFPSILDIKFVGRTSRGHTTGGRSHRIFNPPSFCGACLDFCREKDSAIPFPRRP